MFAKVHIDYATQIWWPWRHFQGKVCTCVLQHPKQLQMLLFPALFAFFFHIPFVSSKLTSIIEVAHEPFLVLKLQNTELWESKMCCFFFFFFSWVNTEMVWCVVWQSAGCCTVEQRGGTCVGWRGKQAAVKSAWLPQSLSHPKVCGRRGRKAFSACWGNKSLTDRMYLCDEESLLCPRKTGSAVLVKGKGNSLSWKKKKKIKKNKSLGQKHGCGSVV